MHTNNDYRVPWLPARESANIINDLLRSARNITCKQTQPSILCWLAKGTLPPIADPNINWALVLLMVLKTPMVASHGGVMKVREDHRHCGRWYHDLLPSILPWWAM
jgi:hypothetical protein